METLSHKFIEALAAPRDRLYALACAKAGAADAEALLHRAAGIVFHEFTQDSFLDISAAMEKALASPPPPPASLPDSPPHPSSSPSPSSPSAAPVVPPVSPEPPSSLVMPADVWARLAAVVQLEASRSSHAQALHPDSVLLRPDPMLAPKKGRPRAEPLEYDVSSPARLFMFLGAAVFIGVAVTVFILTRSPRRPPTSTTAPAFGVPPLGGSSTSAPVSTATASREAP